MTLCELKWIPDLLTDLQISVLILYCDSKATLHITINPVFHESKTLRYSFPFVRDEYKVGFINPIQVKSDMQLATSSQNFFRY